MAGLCLSGADSKELGNQDTASMLVPHKEDCVQTKECQLQFGIQSIYRKWLPTIYESSVNGGCKIQMRNPARCPEATGRGRTAQ